MHLDVVFRAFWYLNSPFVADLVARNFLATKPETYNSPIYIVHFLLSEIEDALVYEKERRFST